MLARRLALVAALSVTALACKYDEPQGGFLHQAHRERYLMTQEEMSKLRYYCSAEVIVQDREMRESGSGDMARVVRAYKGALGRVVDSGPNWLRVKFDDGPGTGVVFVTNTERETDVYWLGTVTEDGQSYVKIRDTEDKVLRHEGRVYDVVEGENATLMVDWRDWENFVRTSRVTVGQPPSQNQKP